MTKGGLFLAWARYMHRNDIAEDLEDVFERTTTRIQSTLMYDTVDVDHILSCAGRLYLHGGMTYLSELAHDDARQQVENDLFLSACQDYSFRYSVDGTSYCPSFPSDPTDPDLPEPPTPDPDEPPLILGSPVIAPVSVAEGDALAVTPAAVTGNPTPSVNLQWTADGVSIAGAVNSTYIAQAADVGKVLACVQTAVNRAGSASEVSNNSDPVQAVDDTEAPQILNPPVIDIQNPVVGDKLRMTPGTMTGNPTPTDTYQWKKDGVDIPWGTFRVYDVLQSDVGAVITVEQTATNSAGTATSESAGTNPVTDPVDPPAPATRRPFGPSAPWNVPLAGIPRAADEAQKVTDLVGRANGINNWNLRQFDYTYVVYDGSDANENLEVNADNSESGLNGTFIPWNRAWTAAAGTDAQIIIYNEDTGEEYNVWKFRGVINDKIEASRLNRIQGNDQGVGTGFADIRKREVGYRPSRGIGISYLAMLVRPWEIAEGKIEHALSMPSPNINNFKALHPATKIEGIQDSGPMLEGQRYSLEVSDAEIDSHLATYPPDVTQQMKDGLKIIFQAMRDYGWFITDNAGAVGLQLEAEDTADWAQVGMKNFTSQNGKQYPRDAMDGLITQGRLRAYVDARDASYPAYSPDQAASYTAPNLG